MEETRENLLEAVNALKEHFHDCADVEAIYLNQEEGWLVATVITNHQAYQRDAIYRLLEREYELHRAHRDLKLEVNYLPGLGGDFEELVPYTARKVFGR